MATRIPSRLLKYPVVALATGFGLGFSPKAPGTLGTLLALPFWWWVLAPLPWLSYLLVWSLLLALGFWCTWRTLRLAGLEGQDDQAIVIDEMLGVWLALLLAPQTWWALLLGFALFRLFDIAKPWPVSWADRQHGTLGIILDDLLAGLLALALLQALVWLLPIGARLLG